MITILCMMCCSAITALGYGAESFLWLKNRYRIYGDIVSIGDLGLIGLLMLALIGTTLNFIATLAPACSTLIALGGFFLFVRHRAVIAQSFCFGAGAVVTLCILLFFTYFVDLHTYISASQHYDTGLYHLQTILQLQDEPVILGEANLHMRFGYNSLWFIVSAMLALPFFGEASLFSANPLIMSLTGLSVAQRCIFGWRNVGFERTAAFGSIAAFVLMSPSFLLDYLGSPNNDAPSSLLVVYVTMVAIFLSDASNARSEKVNSNIDALITLPTLIVLAIASKLSVLPLAGFFMFWVLMWWRTEVSTRQILLGLAFCAGAAILWCARGVATSGCLLYPTPSTCLPLSWAVSRLAAKHDNDVIRSWARQPFGQPDLVLANWDWFPGWLIKVPQYPLIPLLIQLVIMAALMTAWRLIWIRLSGFRQRLSARQQIDALVISIVSLFGLCFWFLTAPDFRFGMSWLVLPPALTIAYLMPNPLTGLKPTGPILLSYAHFVPKRLSRFFASASIALKPKADGSMTNLTSKSSRAAASFKTLLLLITAVYIYKHVPEITQATAFPRTPKATVEIHTTQSGLVVHLPIGGDQCWAAARPCTPYFQSDLSESTFNIWHIMRKSIGP